MPEGKEFDACEICGRTILRGERVAEYVPPDGTPVGVCTLCKPAAEAAGWIPAELAGTLERSAGGRRRGLGLRGRLARASEAARALTARPGRGQEHGSDRTRGATDAKPPERETEARRSRRAGEEPQDDGEPDARRSRSKPRPRTSGAPSIEGLLRRGVAGFNASPEPRKVAGLIRTLGKPRVAVRANSDEAIVVTVAWELSWYQWEVSAGENGDVVREAGKGSEISELTLSDRGWNASAASDGKVTLEPGEARRASGERE